MTTDLAISAEQQQAWVAGLNLITQLASCHGAVYMRSTVGKMCLMLHSQQATERELNVITAQLNVFAFSQLRPDELSESHPFKTVQAEFQVLAPFATGVKFEQLPSTADQVCLLSSQAQFIADTRHDAVWQDCIEIGSLINVPLTGPSGINYGFLCLYHSAPQSLTANALALASLLGENIQSTLAELARSCRQKESEKRGADPCLDMVNLQSFIDSFEEHIWMKNLAGIYTICNCSVEKAWELSRHEIVGKTDNQLFGDEIAQIFLNGDQLAIQSGTPIVVAECLDNGETQGHCWLETLKLPAYGQKGELLGVIGMTRNISKHKAVEEQLTLATNAFKNSDEGVVITDKHGIIRDVNGAFFEITGFSREELIGENPRIFKSGRHDNVFYESFWQVLLSTGKWHGEVWNRRKNGAIFPQHLTISTIYDEFDEIRYFVAVFADISAQKHNEAQLVHLAYFDPLTHLPNRMKLITQLKQEVRQAKRTNSTLAVIYIDIDLFMHINDSFGHSIGDQILITLATRLRTVLGEEQLLSRNGGDEFVVVVNKLNHSDDLDILIGKLRQVFEQPFDVDTRDQLRLTASMGVSLYPDDGSDAETLLRNADAAMYHAKHNGRNGYAFYTQSLTQQSFEHLKLQNALHNAIAQHNLYLMYQPKIDLLTSKVIGFEALLRWNDPQLGSISPAVFIPVAEKIGIIYDIGLWVLENACRQGVAWLNEGKSFGRIAVNVAGPQLQRSSFIADVKDILTKTGLAPRYLELEVTESVMMQNTDVAIRDLQLLGDMGIELSVDDFGTGYSSLSYLKQLPIHKLKIDQSFVRNIPFDTDNTAIAKAVIALGHALKLGIIAEGVETQAQADFLKQNHCDQAQGYLFSRPQLAQDLTDFL